MREGIREEGEVICELPSSHMVREAGLAGKELKTEEEPIWKMTEHILKMSL